MNKYKEKRISHLETRVCINCGSSWKVRIRSSKTGTIKQLLCKDCLNKLSIQERHRLYKLNSKYHEETRTCVHCGKQWIVQVKNGEEPSKVKYFCSNCNSILSPLEKTRILRLKVEGYHEKEKAQRKDSHKRNYIHIMVHRAKQRAQKYGYDFNLEDSDIIIPEKCPLLEVPFIFGEQGNYEYTPTIDRIDNSKGYTKNNIWIISKKANSMKNSASFEELQVFYKNVLRYSLSSREDEPTEQEDKEPLG